MERSLLAPRLAPGEESESPDRASDLVVRGGVEPPTFRFSGVADAQLTADVQEYVAVCGCVGALMTAVVAVMVAV